MNNCIEKGKAKGPDVISNRDNNSMFRHIHCLKTKYVHTIKWKIKLCCMYHFQNYHCKCYTLIFIRRFHKIRSSMGLHNLKKLQEALGQYMMKICTLEDHLLYSLNAVIDSSSSIFYLFILK